MADGLRAECQSNQFGFFVQEFSLSLSLLVLGGIVNLLDRSALSIANTTMRGDLRLSATQLGALLSAFSLAYGFAQIPACWLLERIGPKIVLSAGMLLWSFGCACANGMVSRPHGFISSGANRLCLHHVSGSDSLSGAGAAPN